MITELEHGKYVSLTTYRRNGEPVPTPVEFVSKDGAVYIRTSPTSGKVKRIKRNPNVILGPCTLRGKITGPLSKGVASLVEDENREFYYRFSKKYGLFWRLAVRLRRPTAQYVKIEPR